MLNANVRDTFGRISRQKSFARSDVDSVTLLFGLIFERFSRPPVFFGAQTGSAEGRVVNLLDVRAVLAIGINMGGVDLAYASFTADRARTPVAA